MSRLNILITLALLIKIASYAQSQQPAYQVKASSSSESILFYNGLTELGVAEKAGYYNLLVDSALKGKSVDDAVLALKAAILCDKYDLLASEGKSVRLRYHARNTARISSVCPKVIDAGLEAYGRNDYQRALDCFTLYLERYNTSLFVGKNKDRDPYFNSCAFFAVQAAYKSNHANIVDRYMDRALRSADYAEDATLIRLAMLRDNRQNWQDSLHYATVLSDAHHKYPRNNAIFGMMVDHYSDPARSSEFRRMMEGEVFIDKGNQHKWAMLGELYMRDRQWERAIDAFKHAVDIDTVFVEAFFNIGICYYSNGDVAQSTASLEKCRAMDPDRKKVDWAQPLYTIYKELGEEKKARELLPFIK